MGNSFSVFESKSPILSSFKPFNGCYREANHANNSNTLQYLGIYQNYAESFKSLLTNYDVNGRKKQCCVSSDYTGKLVRYLDSDTIVDKDSKYIDVITHGSKPLGFLHYHQSLSANNEISPLLLTNIQTKMMDIIGGVSTSTTIISMNTQNISKFMKHNMNIINLKMQTQLVVANNTRECSNNFVSDIINENK